jgi:cilia- and flagella-associated protein 65
MVAPIAFCHTVPSSPNPAKPPAPHCMQVQQKTFHVTNTGDMPLSFSWKAPPPFTISPHSTPPIPPGATRHFTANFTAADASVYSATAVCALSNSSTALVKLTAIGKFPFLTLDAPTTEHGDVLVGHSAKRTIRLLNQSLVPAHFTVEHTAGHNDGVFSIAPLTGTVPPGSWATLTIRYRPRFAGTFSSEEFQISTAGGNVVRLRQRGCALGAVVALSQRALDFGDVPLGRAVKKVSTHLPMYPLNPVTAHLCPFCCVAVSLSIGQGFAHTLTRALAQVLTLENKSPVAVAYTINAESKGVFSFHPRFGTLKPSLTATVTITFSPTAERNAWKRLAITLADAEPLDVDLFGTGFSESIRPPPLTLTHIDGFVERIVQGGSVLPPAQTEDGSLPATPPLPRPRIPEMPGILGYHSWDLLFAGQDVAHGLSVEPSLLEFSPATVAHAAERQHVSVANHLPFKITASVAVPVWTDTASKCKPARVWRVTPDAQDIGPGKSAVFEVMFKPPADGHYYTQAVDVVAHATYMRNFRLCSEVHP